VKQEQHMADNTEITPDSEARKWFTIAIIGAFLYVSTVFAFIITRDVETESAQEVPPHGQSR
jgi:hypothetical protein